MGNIIWLASYPKSGNTWFRVFLTNLLKKTDNPVDINNLIGGPIASARHLLDEPLGYDSGDLSPDECDLLRPEAYIHFSKSLQEQRFCKIHDAYTYLPNGKPLVPKEATKKALYFVRNPLDICISFAHHSGHDNFKNTSKILNNPKFAFCGEGKRQTNQLRQILLTWSGHYLSWTCHQEFLVKVIKYEDMVNHPLRTFSEAVAFAELDYDEKSISKAIENSNIDTLQKQEQEKGFGEKMIYCKTFFRNGKVGSFNDFLSKDQINELTKNHCDVMETLEYLNINEHIPLEKV